MASWIVTPDGVWLNLDLAVRIMPDFSSEGVFVRIEFTGEKMSYLPGSMQDFQALTVFDNPIIRNRHSS